ncbi:hypothetical protein VKT23_018196 [Stygiomarasmius scandens]|uniref:F-box domain-containing protein n=1 Tax=Marasmiellus scandens TaxID=2682957 RepID=A0ABR1ISM0_9AGAR
MEERRTELEQNAKRFSQHVDQLLQCFTRRLPRWRNVELRMNRYCARMFEGCMTTLDDQDWQVPLLDSFTFDLLLGSSRQDLALTCLSKFLSIPHLRCVTVTADIQHVLQYLGQSNANLFQLDLLGGMFSLGLEPPDLLSLLPRYANLHTCHFDVHVPQTLSLESHPVISLPHLQKLSLNFSVERGISNIDHVLFNKLSVPALRSLTVTVSRIGRVIFERAPFIPWLADGQIRELNLGTPLSLEAYLECLALVPNLTQLAVCDMALNEESAKAFVDHLIPSSEGPSPLCPKIRQLSFLGLDVDDKLVLDLAYSRKNPVLEGIASLEVFRARFQRCKQLADIDDLLDALRKQGMEITFEYQAERRDKPSLGQRQVAGLLPFDHNTLMPSEFMVYT